MKLSIRLSVEEEALLARAAAVLRIDKSEFVRRSIVFYAHKMIPCDKTAAEIDALFVGQGGGLRPLDSVAHPGKKAIAQRLRERYVEPR